MKTSEPSRLLKFMRVKGIRIIAILLLFLVIGACLYTYHQIDTYNSISITIKKDMALEYGSANYNIRDFIEKIEGKIVSVKNVIDTNTVGEQEVVLEVQKENIVKDVPLMISVIDTVAPVIKIKEEKVSATQGTNYDLLSNIVSVTDEIDGDIPYLSEVEENSVFYYHLDYDNSTIKNVGDHEITIVAKDKNGNSSTASYVLQVVAPKKAYYQYVYSNLAPNSNASRLVSIAYSYLGYPYVGGANGPYSFDCSGFVQYVYRQVGINISRSTSTQIRDGLGVAYADIQPGDIICWGYSNGTVTHSTLYVGDGKMIHAANPSVGVVISDVSHYLATSGTTILSIRRIQG